MIKQKENNAVLLLLCFCAVLCCIILKNNFINIVYADATDIQEQDSADSLDEMSDNDFVEGVDGEAYNVFYVPKASFTSDSAYKKYCKNMYRHGYMDSDYNWTDSAQDCINNPTKNNYEKMDNNAKQIVDERIRDGEMKAEENPYLTYEEIQSISNGESTYDEVLANRNITGENESSTSGSQNETDPAITVTETPEDIETPQDDDNEIVSPTITPEEEVGKTPESDNSFGFIRFMIMAAIVVVIAFVSCFIYKKQF